jgi:hypothetical protein
MNRRSLLASLATGTIITTTGYLGAVAYNDSRNSATYSDTRDSGGGITQSGFDDYRYENNELVVDLQGFDEVEEITFRTSAYGETIEHETISEPGDTARFQVVFPEKLDTRMTKRMGEHLLVTTAEETTRLSVSEPVHGVIKDVIVRDDGAVECAVENLAAAPILTRFIAIHGDAVPNPTVKPWRDSFTRDSLQEPNVVGTDVHAGDTDDRSALVVPSGETVSYRSTDEPFRSAGDPDGETVRLTLVYGAGGAATWSFEV